MAEQILIFQIDRPPETQPRTTMVKSIVNEYAEAMKTGVTFPPVDVFKVEDRFILVDGFHRISAAERANVDKFPCEIHEGTMRDAILFTVSANAAHGLRRSPKDKRRAVERLLADAEWSQWNDSEIAEKCNVSHSFVSKVRQASFHDGKMADERKVKRGSTTFSMTTKKIGRKTTAKKPALDKHASLPESSSSTATVANAFPAKTHQQPPTSDKGQEEPVRDDVPVVSSDAPIKYSQQNIVPSSPASNIPWMLPTRQLSPDEWKDFFADFISVACTLEQQQMIKAVIANGKFANELEVVDYSLDLVGKLDEAAKSFNIPHGQIPTSEQIMRYTFNPQWFAPVFPVKQPVSTKYSGTMPEISVIAVDVYVEYFSNDEVLL